MSIVTFERYKELCAEYPELTRNPKGAFNHLNDLRSLGYRSIGSLNHYGFKAPEGVETCSLHYGENCYTIYISPKEKQFYILDSGD